MSKKKADSSLTPTNAARVEKIIVALPNGNKIELTVAEARSLKWELEDLLGGAATVYTYPVYPPAPRWPYYPSLPWTVISWDTTTTGGL